MWTQLRTDKHPTPILPELGIMVHGQKHVAPYRVYVLRDGGCRGRVDPLLLHLRPPHPVLQRRPAVVLRSAGPGRPAAHRAGCSLNVVDPMMQGLK